MNTGDPPHLLWKQQFKTPLVIEPTMALGAMIVTTTNRRLHVISLKTGERLAEIDLGEPVSTTVCLRDSLAVINENGRRLKIKNWVSQRLIWQVDLEGSEVEPVVFNGRVYWQNGMRNLNCYDLVEGRRVWDRRLDLELSSPPSADSQGLVFTSETGAIDCLDPENGIQRWSFNSERRVRNSPVISGADLIYCTVDGRVGCLKMLDGSRVWTTDLEAMVVAPVATDGDGVFIGTNDGQLLKLDFNTGQTVWKLQAGGPIKGGAVVAGNLAVFPGLDHKAYFVDKNRGTIEAEYETKGMLSTRPVVCGDRIYIAGEDRNLHCLQLSEEQ